MTKNNIFYTHAAEPWNLYSPAIRSLSARDEASSFLPENARKKPENKSWREYFGEMWTQRKPYSVDAYGIAHIDIFGILLFRQTDFVLAWYGGSDYTEIMEEIDRAESDDSVKGIILTVDSPGGMAFGNNRCAKRIAECQKPIFAHTDGLCCSAAYALACGANHLAATEDSDVGCIGTILPMIDESELWKSFGIAPDYIVNKDGDLKTETYPPSRTPEQKASLQEQVEDTYALFKAHVLDNRTLEPDSMRGQTFVGERAKERGLVDEICPFAQTYDNLRGFVEI